MSDEPPLMSPDPSPDGWERACEGILRTEFGRRPSVALARAMAELRAEAGAEDAPREFRAAAGWVEVVFRVRRAFAELRAKPWSGALAGLSFLLVLGAMAGGARWWMNRGILEVVSVQGQASLLGPGSVATLRAGQRARPGNVVVLESNAVVRLRYPSEATHVKLIGPATLAPERSRAGKRLRLEGGEAAVVAAPQPAGKPLRIRTPHGESEVVGTAFTLAVRRASTWLEVADGVVALSRPAGLRSESVRVGRDEFAVAAEGVELVARRRDYASSDRPKLALTLDFSRGSTSGDGDWVRFPTGVRQRRVAMTAWGSTPESKAGGPRFPISDFRVPLVTSGSVLLEATVTVDRLPVDVRPDSKLRGRVGLKLFDGRALLDFLLSGAEPGPSQVFAFTELNEAQGNPSRIVAGGPGPALAAGTFRLMAQFTRLDTGGVRVSGKIWQGALEPEAWAIEGEVPEFGPVRAFALDTMHCAATFTDVRAWLLD